jgi:hypothetical protein
VTSPVSELVCRRYRKVYPDTGKCICFNLPVQLAVFLLVNILANMSKINLEVKTGLGVPANVFLEKVLGTTLASK